MMQYIEMKAGTGEFRVGFDTTAYNANFTVEPILDRDFVGRLSLGDILLSGNVKFDGCMNFSGERNIMIHLCSNEDMLNLVQLLPRLRAACIKRIPMVLDEVAEEVRGVELSCSD